MTSKEPQAIYASEGIIFQNGYILTPWGEWIKPVLKFGSNGKVGQAFTFSIWHGNETISAECFGPKTRAAMAAAGIQEITGSCPCHCNGCYCDTGRYLFDQNKKMSVVHLILARYHTDWLYRAIRAQIIAEKAEQVRIHAQGDFAISPAYVAMWGNIAADFPEVIFWTYTKDREALRVLQGKKNVFITPSCTPYGFNFGTCAELLEMHRLLTAKGYRVHICACGTPTQKEMDLHCSSCHHGCKAVGVEVDFVLFIKHSTKDYKAGKNDPVEYAMICEIVAAQQN